LLSILLIAQTLHAITMLMDLYYKLF